MSFALNDWLDNNLAVLKEFAGDVGANKQATKEWQVKYYPETLIPVEKADSTWRLRARILELRRRIEADPSMKSFYSREPGDESGLTVASAPAKEMTLADLPWLKKMELRLG